jgi:ABC-type uncharacterized transport system involved in gliding motility auxiliary subunit
LFGAGPFAPLVVSYEPHAITAEMGNVATIFPLVRSVTPGGSKDKVTAEKLLSTTAKSYAVTNYSTPELQIDPKKDKAGPHVLAAAGIYRGEGGAQGRFVAVGTSRFATNNPLMARQMANRDLFLNMMSWLSSDEDLISIRPKEPEDRRLTVSQAQMNTLLFSHVFGLPVVILGVGIFVWWRRR